MNARITHLRFKPVGRNLLRIFAAVSCCLLPACKAPGKKPRHVEITPPEAKAMLDAEQGYIYLDVRTEEEFAEGHVPGAWNVPVVFFGEGGRKIPNEAFVDVVGAHLPKGRPMIVGCRSGRRSAIAADKLAEQGYTHLHNMIGGYSAKKGVLGDVVVPGWSMRDYPVETGDGGERSYAALRDER